MTLPSDSPGVFPDVPLQGHLCSLKRNGVKCYWQVEKLIEASRKLPVQEMQISELLPRISNGSWYGSAQKPTIGSIIEHVERAIKADVTCPIILAEDGKVMDGSHRIVGALIKGIKTVPAVQFERDPEPGYVERPD